MEIKEQAFARIKKFVRYLNDELGDVSHPLNLYNLLLETKTTPKAIIKNNAVFAEFALKNKNSILKRSEEIGNIVYTPDKVYIDMSIVFKTASDSIKEQIWDDLWFITAYVYPKLGTKALLKERIETREERFIDDLVKKIEAVVDPNTLSNPEIAVFDMMQSGTLMELSQNIGCEMAKGRMDIQKLVACAKKLMGDEGVDEAGLGQISGMLGNIFGNTNVNVEEMLKPKRAKLELIEEQKEE